jgi:tetratricopeptide (TPR) repeat protein
MRSILLFLALSLCLPMTACDGEGPDEGDLQAQNLELQAKRREMQADLEESKERIEKMAERLRDQQQKRRTLQQKTEELEQSLLEQLDETRRKLEKSQERVEELEAMQEPDETEAEQAEDSLDPAEQVKELNARMQAAARNLSLLGATLMRDEQFEGARLALLTARQLGADAPIVHYHLAAASAELEKWENARDSYARVIEALQQAERELSTAEQHMLKAALLNSGVALEHLDKYGKAAENYVSALEHDREYAPAYYNLGVLYARKLDDREKAITLLRKHSVLNGRRSASAMDLIEELQKGPEEAGEAEEDEEADAGE